MQETLEFPQPCIPSAGSMQPEILTCKQNKTELVRCKYGVLHECRHTGAMARPAQIAVKFSFRSFLRARRPLEKPLIRWLNGLSGNSPGSWSIPVAFIGHGVEPDSECSGI